MPSKEQPPEHPQVVATRAEQEDREKNAAAIKKMRETPHPQMAIAAALGTEPHTIDREAFQEYQAGHTKKAAAAQTKADEPSA